ncbi:MAG TPA: dehydrogenase, partial [Clostridiales bacterium]|nr:dehydrogenase [Clostridiales bacterium]
GVQIVGGEGVDKRIDVFVTAITFKAKVSDLFHLDLAYAPPFSTTKDPVMYTGMILDNAISKGRELITFDQLNDLIKLGKKVEIIDTRVQGSYEESHIDNAISAPHSQFRDYIKNMDKDTIAVTYCNKGTTGNATQNILINKGFKETYNISGGYNQYKSKDKEK